MEYSITFKVLRNKNVRQNLKINLKVVIWLTMLRCLGWNMAS